MRPRILLILVTVAVVVIAALVLAQHDPIRSWRIVQTKPLADGISMRVENLFLFPSGTNTLLRFRCRYLGGNPNERFSLRASLLTALNPPGMDRIPTWQVGVPDDGRGGIPMIWEFGIDTPKSVRNLILRVYWHPHAGDKTERFVDFNVPYLPRLTPHGEVDA
jgi:hypothetical protein